MVEMTPKPGMQPLRMRLIRHVPAHELLFSRGEGASLLTDPFRLAMNRSGRFINTHPRRPPGLAASEEPRARSGRLFSLARFQAYVVFGLAYLRRVIFRAGSLLLAALLAIVRLFGS